MNLSQIFSTNMLMLVLAATALTQSAHPSLSAKTTYVVSGHILDSEGKPASSIRVCAFAEDFSETKPNFVIPCAFSDHGGNFTIAFERAGKYKLFPEQADLGYWTTRLPFFSAPSIMTAEVVIDKGSPRGPVTVLLPPKNGLIKGKAIDVKTGLPLESVEFTLCHVADPQVCRTSVAKSSDGSFQIPAPHVPFTLRARAEGLNEWLGLSGRDTAEINVEDSTLQLNLFLTRLSSAVNKEINEAEKQPGVNLPAPVQLKPADGILFNVYPRKTKLEWASVDGAVSYSVEVDFCKPARGGRTCGTPYPLTVPANLPMVGITSTSYEFGFVGAQPGRWRVWAVDKDGREGFKSNWRTFVYLQ
jgi:hypothetical protein